MTHMQPHRVHTKKDTYLVLSIHTPVRSKREVERLKKTKTLPRQPFIKDITLDVYVCLINVSTFAAFCMLHRKWAVPNYSGPQEHLHLTHFSKKKARQ